MHALRRAKEHGLMTILNPAPAAVEAGQADLLRLVDVLTPNETEAITLAGRCDAPLAAIDAARLLRSRGAKDVIVTRGAAGCVLVGEDEVPVPARRVAVVDTTAAGDAFTGALAAALAERAVADRRRKLGHRRGRPFGDATRGDRLASPAARDRGTVFQMTVRNTTRSRLAPRRAAARPAQSAPVAFLRGNIGVRLSTGPVSEVFLPGYHEYVPSPPQLLRS